MNNRSLSPSQKPLFSPSYISELSICHIAHILFLFSPISLQLFSSGLFHFPSSHMLLAQSQLSLLSQSNVLGHTSGIPWQGSPLPSLHHHPQHFFLMGLTGSRSFVGLRLCLLKKQNWCRTKTMRGGLSFISGPSGGSTWSCSRPLSALNCTTAFINYQLISSKYDYLCSHADDWWDFQRNT